MDIQNAIANIPDCEPGFYEYNSDYDDQELILLEELNINEEPEPEDWK